MISFILLILTLLVTLPLIPAQIGYDAKAARFLCQTRGTRHCAASSLRGSSIISCSVDGTAEIRSCLVELSRILPAGYERAAVCYESSPRSGDAVCAFNGTGYTFSGAEVDVPETVLCQDTRISSVHIDKGIEAGDTEEPTRLLTDSRIFVREEMETAERLPYTTTSMSTVTLGVGLSLPIPYSLTSRDGDETESGSGRAGKDEGVVCSNLWTTGTAKGEDALTLDNVLVVPTQGISAAESTPKVPTHVITSPGVFVTQTARVSHTFAGSTTNNAVRSAATSASVTDITSVRDSTTTHARVSSSWDGAEVLETGVSRGANSMCIKRSFLRNVFLSLVLISLLS
ncbi:uncharacterized protein BJX67DRAFT_380351 [Aspergillus lucknowensis]|uniref:Uncharacterized protein n=1 Tax=Aspergillus lucknowensis TaxID=176173 RepID=A0ABR4LXS6_9EURO